MLALHKPPRGTRMRKGLAARRQTRVPSPALTSAAAGSVSPSGNERHHHRSVGRAACEASRFQGPTQTH